MPARIPKPVTEQIREAILASGLSRYRICQETGIDQAAMSRFMAGTGGLGLDNLDTLCAFLGLSIVNAQQAKKK